MKTVTFYDLTTGQFTNGRTYCGPAEYVEVNTPAGFGAIEGSWSELKFKVDLKSMKVQQFKPPEPPASSLVAWRWDEPAWAWVATETVEARAIKVRDARDDLLQRCDWTQLADCTLNASKRAEWLAYRQALRQVPGQPDFPDRVTWPAEPQ
jgi:Phage tail assembly chaperone protein